MTDRFDQKTDQIMASQPRNIAVTEEAARARVKKSLEAQEQAQANERSTKGVKGTIMTNTARDMKRTESQERSARYAADTSSRNVDKQVAQSDKESKRRMAVDVLKALLSLVPNDPKWYKNIPESAAFAPNNKVLIPGGVITGTDTLHSLNRPQVMVLKYDNIFGNLADVKYSNRMKANALNSNSIRLATNIRATSSRPVSIDEAADFFQYLVAGTDVMVHFFRLLKAMKAAYTFDYNNRDIGNLIISGCGFNASDFRTNLQKYKEWILTKQEEIRSLIVLPNASNMLSYVSRKLWLAAGIYKDDSTPTPQYLLTCPNRWMYYDEANALVEQSDFIKYDGETYNTFSSRWEQRINAFRFSSAINSLISDLKGSGVQLFELPRITLEYISSPLDIPDISEVKHQFMNATMPAFIPEHRYMGGNSITNAFEEEYALLDSTTVLRQDGNGLLYVGPSMADSAYLYTSKVQVAATNSQGVIGIHPVSKFIRSYEKDLSPDDFLVYTRLKCTYLTEATQTSTVYSQTTQIILGGTEAVSHIIFASSPDGSIYPDTNTTTVFTNALGQASGSGNLMISSFFSDMDFVPEFVQYTSLFDGTAYVINSTGKFAGMYSKGANYKLDSEALELTHRVCVASEFFVVPSKSFRR